MITVSVVIPAWNGSAYLPACLDALLAQAGAPLEVTVVDNASTDGSADLVAGRYPQVRLIRHERNLGFSGGCNAGLRVATGEILILLNQDTVVAPDWLPALLPAFENPAIGIAGCKSFFQDGQLLQHAGAYIEWPLGWSHHYGYREPDGPAWSEPRAVEFVTGAALAMRRAVLDGIGLLDENFWPGYFEDVDYCFRARAQGFGVWYWPAARLVHLERKSPIELAALNRYLHLGRLRFLLKHMPPQRWLSEFVPAEQAYQRQVAGGALSPILRLGYLQSTLIVAGLFRQRGAGAAAFLEPVTATLLQLYREGWLIDAAALEASHPGRISANAANGVVSEGSSPTRPPAGLAALFARVLQVWYGLTGRTERRRRVVQQQRYLKALNQRLELLAEENALVASYIVQHQAADPHSEPATHLRRNSDRVS